MTTFANHVVVANAKHGFVAGQSSAILELNAFVRVIAESSISVLIVGESGTGKEVYARLIHQLSAHCEGPFIKLNCRAAEPAEFLAKLRASLTRHEDPALEVRRTIFLDGIDELELASQTALLSLLPEGDSENQDRAQVRLISSASRDIDKEIERNRFRKELFFRINGVCLRLPPLRKRKSDLPVFLEYFLAKYSLQANQGAPALGQRELDLLETYDWPGNIRELENFARKISLFSNPRMAIEELFTVPRVLPTLPGDSPTLSLKAVARSASRDAEREMIREALERTHWNRKRAAQQLNISYKSLLYKIKQTGLAR